MRNPAVSPLTAEELVRWLETEPPTNEKPDGGYAIVDVRPPDRFAKEHVPGAENVPLERFGELRRRFAREKVIVVYGEGDEAPAERAGSTAPAADEAPPDAPASDAWQAAAALSAHGFVRIQCLEGGFSAWLEAQHRLEHARRARAGRRQLRSAPGPTRPDGGD